MRVRKATVRHIQDRLECQASVSGGLNSSPAVAAPDL